MKKIVSMKKDVKSDTKEERLKAFAEKMEQMKMEFAELADAYEEEGADGAVLDSLFEALAAVDDVIDGVTEALERS